MTAHYHPLQRGPGCEARSVNLFAAEPAMFVTELQRGPGCEARSVAGNHHRRAAVWHRFNEVRAAKPGVSGAAEYRLVSHDAGFNEVRAAKPGVSAASASFWRISATASTRSGLRSPECPRRGCGRRSKPVLRFNEVRAAKPGVSDIRAACRRCRSDCFNEVRAAKPGVSTIVQAFERHCQLSAAASGRARHGGGAVRPGSNPDAHGQRALPIQPKPPLRALPAFRTAPHPSQPRGQRHHITIASRRIGSKRRPRLSTTSVTCSAGPRSISTT